jgi:DNA polymerase III sliding clamp (beta) subunit (PCNA family)
VGLTLGSGQLKLSAANGEYGEATDELMVETHGEEAKIGFNSQYLLDFLSVAGTAKIRLEMKNENPAARLVTCPDPEDKSALNYQYVVMPMRY